MNHVLRGGAAGAMAEDAPSTPVDTSVDTPLAVPRAAHSSGTPQPIDVYLATLAPGSRMTMRESLRAVTRLLTGAPVVHDAEARAIPWHLLQYHHLTAIRAALAERYAPAVANKHLAAVKGVLRAAWQLELISGEAYYRACGLPPVKGERAETGRHIAFEEVVALLDACAADASPLGRRDAAILALLYGTGMRRAEVAALRLGDYQAERQRLLVRGKGNKQRYAYLVDEGLRAALLDWLVVRATLDAGVAYQDAPAVAPEREPLFFAFRRNGRLAGRRGLAGEMLATILARRAAEAGLAAGLAPHDFRRTFAGNLLDAGVDLVVVQKLMGHAEVTTTARYDRRAEAERRKAARRIHVPYAPPVAASPLLQRQSIEDASAHLA